MADTLTDTKVYMRVLISTYEHPSFAHTYVYAYKYAHTSTHIYNICFGACMLYKIFYSKTE